MQKNQFAADIDALARLSVEEGRLAASLDDVQRQIAVIRGRLVQVGSPVAERETRVADTPKMTPAEKATFDAVKKAGKLSPAELQKLLGITPAAAYQRLSGLKGRGLLDSTRGKYWVPQGGGTKQ